MAQRALEGVVVIDAGHIMASPFCTMMLGDLGADVIKIEKPEGDDTRRFGPPFVNGESAAFLAVNRNKRGLVLNLKQEGAPEIFRNLVSRADIIVENYKPGTMDRLGLGYEDLKEVNPSLIYCSITGFGQDGPYRDRRGFDLVAQAMSGLISVTGHRNGPPTKVGVPLSDLAAALYAAQAILAAYIHRLKTGEGQHIDVSLLDAAISLTVWESASYFATGLTPEPVGSAHRLLAPYQVFLTANKPIVVGAGNQSIWRRLCSVVERMDLLEDPRFLTNELRTTNQDELAEELSPIFATHEASYWLERLENAGVPTGPVYDIDDVYNDPHVQAREMSVAMEHPEAGAIMQIGSPMKFSSVETTFRRPAPALGQHSGEILAWLGYSEEEIATFRDKGVIYARQVAKG